MLRLSLRSGAVRAASTLHSHDVRHLILTYTEASCLGFSSRALQVVLKLAIISQLALTIMKRSLEIGDQGHTGPPFKRAKLRNPGLNSAELRPSKLIPLPNVSPGDVSVAIAQRNADAKNVDIQHAEDTIDAILSSPDLGPLCSATWASDDPLSSDGNGTLICYGKVSAAPHETILLMLTHSSITNVKCKLLHLRANANVAAESLCHVKAGSHALKVRSEAGSYLVAGHIPSKHSFLAQLNCKVVAALTKVLEAGQILLHPRITHSEVKRLLASRPSQDRKPKVFLINISIVGSDHLSDRVGLTLSEHGLYLQHPGIDSVEFCYKNPHLVRFDDLCEDDIRIAKAGLLTSYFSDFDEKHNLSSMLGQFTHSLLIDRELDNSRIATELFQYVMCLDS